MTWSLSISGSGGDADDLKEIFENTVRAGRAVDGATVAGGALSGTEDGQPFTFSAADVVELEAVDTGDEASDPAGDPSADAVTQP